MTVLFVFAARVVLVGFKLPLDRLRPDDSILALVCVFGGLMTWLYGVPWNASSVTLGAGAP